MDIKIKLEIERLEAVRDTGHDDYIARVEELENKIKNIEYQVERTESPIKRGILKKQKSHCKEEINRLDQNIEKFTNNINEKVTGLTKLLEDWEEKRKKEKESIEYNVEKIRDRINRENMNDVFEMFEAVANSLEIIQKKLTSS